MKYTDSSSRTTVISKQYYTLIAAVLALIIALPIYIAGSFHYSNVVAKSSSPIGTTMKFSRSNANVTLSGLYTDKDNSALVARLSVPASSAAKLPAQGKDYRVFVASDRFGKDVKEMDVLFGRLSTDGDLFLVIPKPNDGVYSVFIMNRMFLGIADSTTGGNVAPKLSDEDANATKQSITRALSEYQYSPNTSAKPYTIKNDKNDMIGFRLTTRPAFDTAEYKPVVLDTTLIEGSKFNFKNMFDALFKEAAYSQLDTQFNVLSDQSNALKKNLEEYQQRLIENPTDKAALTASNKVKERIRSLDRKKQDIAEQMNRYEQLEFSNKMFSNLQEKAWVIEKP